MREFRTYGSVGEAPGNRCLYPEANSVQALEIYFSLALPLNPTTFNFVLLILWFL